VGIKILLADDSVTAQNMGKKILSEAGHEVVTVSNGAAAAKKIAEIKPELVLLDVFMPGYSGLELCEKLRNAGATSKLPVLLTVGRMEPYNPQDGARVKADGVIVKPFEASDLTAAVDRIAEKLTPGKQAVPKSEPPVAKSEQSLPRIEQFVPKPEPPQPAKPAEYEETVRLDSAEIAAALKNGAPEKTSPSVEAPVSQFNSAAPAHEFHVAPAGKILDELHTAATPAFGSELESTNSTPAHASVPAGVPSYMSQYLEEEKPTSGVELSHAAPQPGATAAAPAKFVSSFEMPARQELAPAIEVSGVGLVQHFEPAPNSEPPVASAQGLELTAAAPVGDIPVVREAAFEPTLQVSDAPTEIPKDPAFESDPHHAAMDFPTHFGTDISAASDLPLPTETSSDPADEFETRLKAALSSFEEPSADLPLASSSAPAGFPEIDPEPITHLTPVPESFDSRLEAAMHAFDAAGEPGSGLPSHALEEIQASEPDEMDSARLIEPEHLTPISLESPSAHPVLEEVSPAVEAVSSMKVPHAVSETAHVPEMDEAVIHQMRESFSALPAESGHAAVSEDSHPMAMAAAASTTGAPVSRETELQLSRAVMTAINGQAPFPDSEPSSQATEGPDAGTLAAAVEKVMQRELPSLVWKIMAELDLHKKS
jgi:CheY-like chemotaxis protein